MPIEATPLFRPEILRPRVTAFDLPAQTLEARARLASWVELLDSPEGMGRKETELLPDYLTDVFQRVLGYRGPAEREEGRHTLSREKLVEVDGKFADAVLGEFAADRERFVAAVEGKGPKDPLDRPFAGRRMSAVDQGYRYAINLPADWVIVTNLREIRLYHKGATQRTYERFLLRDLASDDYEFRRFVFLLGAERVVPREGPSHLHELLDASERAGERLTREFYRVYSDIRHDLLNALIEANPDVPPSEVLTAAQRLLDRTLFIAFAEDRSLLPADTLAHAYRHRDPYNPRPIWDNFRGLFRAIDAGSDPLGIPRYNGGLFSEHELLDKRLVVPDPACELLKRLGDYNYGTAAQLEGGNGEARLVDVEILGHIFEQSIEDLEAIRAEIEGGQATRATSKRRREGAFYTPAFVTRYVVSQALAPVLAERFERLRAMHQEKASGTAVSVLADPRVYDLEKLNNPQRDALIAFWEAWIEDLKTVRVVDPACGSGAFLIEVFDQLHVEYRQAVDRLAELRRGGFAGFLFDPDRTILQNNIYGVDLNEEAVEIARLSIWIKTAQRGKVLTDLDHNIRVGNSVIADPEIDPRAFDWWSAFPEVAAQGGFDVVIGNPPYVRAEFLVPIKAYLEEHYDAYHGQADLYVYFYELGIRLLRPGGRLSYIVTNKWLRTGYGEPLRRFFAEKTWVETVVDLGHAKDVFPDADVFPSIILARKPDRGPAPDTVTACVIPREDVHLENLANQVEDIGFEMPRSLLTAGPWTLEPPGLDSLFAKLRKVGVPLREYSSTVPKYGIKTGYNEAYVISTAERDALVAEDPACVDIIHPCVRGQDIGRWSPAWADLWMIVMKSSSDHRWPWSGAEEEEAERLLADTYPAIHQHFKAHEERLRARRDQGQYWWELRSCDYYDAFHGPKILYTDITWRSQFCFVPETLYFVNTVYMWPANDLFLLGVMNSPLMWSYMWRNAQHGKDEALRLFTAFLETAPVPRASDDQRALITGRVERLMMITAERHRRVRQLLDWLRVEFGVEKPGQKLSEPHELDSDTFVAEVKKRRAGKSTVTASELRRLREEFYRVATPLREGARESLRLESEVSDLVNEAYGLTPEEVDLLWQTAPPRMPNVARREVEATVDLA